MKKGTVVLLFSSIVYLLAVFWIITYGFSSERAFVGEKSLSIMDETTVAKKVNHYVDQSARNSMYLAVESMNKKGIFDSKECKFVEDTVLLFSDESCKLDKETLEKVYLENFKKSFESFLKKQLYEVEFVEGINNYDISVSFGESWIEVLGKAENSLHFEGEDVEYDFNPSFRERISFDLLQYVDMYDDIEMNLLCIERNKQDFISECGFSESYWLRELGRKGGIVFLRANVEGDSFWNKIDFSFAINLNKIQKNKDNALFS